MKPKVYTILVTYNPNMNELKDSLLELKKQTSFIVICNNSLEDLKIQANKTIKLFNFGTNLGIAKAQSIGMKWAFDNGADFILQMDQDSIPEVNMVDNLCKCYNELTESGYKIGLVGPQDFDKDTKIRNKARINKGYSIVNKSYSVLQNTLSSGSLISKEIYKLIGGMDDDLFIDAVDSEYCWRIIKNNFLVIKNDNALLGHKLGEGKRKVLKFINIGISSPIRNYYQIRNVILLLTRTYVPLYWKLSHSIKLIFKLLFYPLILDNGIKRFKYQWYGFWDGIFRIVGRYDHD